MAFIKGPHGVEHHPLFELGKIGAWNDMRTVISIVTVACLFPGSVVWVHNWIFQLGMFIYHRVGTAGRAEIFIV